MKSRLGILLLSLLCCASCVSKKKYMALEAVRNNLETEKIHQYKTIDTLKWEKQQQASAIGELQRDTMRLRSMLRESRKDLERIQNHLTSSKKELNDRIQELQRRDTAIHDCQTLCQSYTDSLQLIREAADFSLGLLLEEDSGYREIGLYIEERNVVLNIPENFFFTPNNRNFISTKGKEMLKVVTELYQKYPTIRIEVAAPIQRELPFSTMKEQMDKESMRTAAVCRSLLTEHQIPPDRLHSGLFLYSGEWEEAPEHRILLRISLDMAPVFEAVKNL